MAVDILEILKTPEMTKICAPMVRYSKLAFRTLMRRNDCDICFTPMIMADSFIQSPKARDNEFTTNLIDEPLIVQFAAKTAMDFVDAAELVAPYSNGVDLNCGCPQRWAIKDGYGCDLLNHPQLVKDLVLSVRNRIPTPFTVSVKIRLLNDMEKCVELCQILEHAGVSFITVHGRTPQMRREPIIMSGLKLIRDCTQIPLIVNGDVKSLKDAKFLYEETNCQGVMAASGLLTNPSLFSGTSATPVSCIQDWLDITAVIPTNFMTVHHHLTFMLEKILPRKERLIFNNIQNFQEMHAFIDAYYGIQSRFTAYNNSLGPIVCNYDTRKREIVEYISTTDSDISWQESLNSLFFCDNDQSTANDII